MSSMFASHTLITGGTFSLNHNDSVRCHGHREGSDILHRTTATAAFHNSEERFDPPKCHPNTRVAVLNKIMKWIQREEDLDAFIMWLYGPAGAGKSAIAETIAEICEDEMILLASFFFSRNDPSRCTVKPLIATIVYQITLNLPDLRDAILSAIERDPLIFSKSIAVQVKSLIVMPLQQLADTGFFEEPTARRLIIIDGLDECSDPKVQRNILDVLVNSQRQYRLPLIFLIVSRPEKHISLTFSTGLLSSVTTRVALDDSYLPDDDIKLFLADKFQEIKSTHPLHAYIPPEWPFPDVFNHLVKKSSGQFIYASTVIHYVSSIRHQPTDRLDVVLGIRPPLRDLPFAELDALYMHILAGVEEIEPVLEIFSIILLLDRRYNFDNPCIEEFLSLRPGDIQLYFGDLSSLVNITPHLSIRILHASLTDFLVDHTRSKKFWINPPARHAVFAHQCLQLLQFQRKLQQPSWTIIFATIYHLENAEMIPELQDDLINFSLNGLHDAIKNVCGKVPDMFFHVFTFTPFFLMGLKKLPLSETAHICQTLQVDFDQIICHVLEKIYSFPGFTLLLGGVLQDITTEPSTYIAEFLYLVPWHRELDLAGSWKIMGVNIINCQYSPGKAEFLTYFKEFLQNPERSGNHVFDQQRYATAVKECLRLCLCSHHHFPKRVIESVRGDRILCRNKPWEWRRRLGAHGRIRKSRHQFMVRERRKFKATHQLFFSYPSRPTIQTLVEDEYSRSFVYEWALDLLPLLLGRSAVSSEMADVLRNCIFATMGLEFPRKTRVAKDAMRRYILRVESAMGHHGLRTELPNYPDI